MKFLVEFNKEFDPHDRIVTLVANGRVGDVNLQFVLDKRREPGLDPKPGVPWPVNPGRIISVSDDGRQVRMSAFPARRPAKATSRGISPRIPRRILRMLRSVSRRRTVTCPPFR